MLQDLFHCVSSESRCPILTPTKTGAVQAEGAPSPFGGGSDRVMRRVVFAAASAGIRIMAFILLFLAANGLPVRREAPLEQILFSTEWYPTEEPPAFGMAALIAGTLSVTLLSCLLAVPAALALGVFTSEAAPRRASDFFKLLLELLSFLPSIVLGFIGMTVVAPWMQESLGAASGLNLLNASLMLGFLMIPQVASLTDEALASVPRDLRDASYALGATRTETVLKVVFPAAARGISAAVLLGVMRALGETMVVLMAAGGAAVLPSLLTDPVRPLTSTIAAEMGETPFGSAHYHALFFAGLLLLLMTLALNIVSMRLERKGMVK